MMMKPIIIMLFLLLPLFITQFSQVEAAKSKAKPKIPGKKLMSPNPQITVMGFVYCDICSNNTFSRHSYFLPDVEVRIDCVFKAMSAKTKEQISVSVNRTTNKYGMYKLEIPSVDGVRCAEDSELVSSCQASLVGSSSSASACNVPGYRTTSDEIAIKARSANLCIYSLNALNFRPHKRDATLCAGGK